MSKLLKFSEDIQIADKYKIRFSIHRYGIVRCKLKPQGGTTLQPLGWLLKGKNANKENKGW